MQRGRIIEICALVSVLLIARAKAVSNQAGSYEGIAERNVFHLHPPPLQPPMDIGSFRPPLPKITLAGTTSILGKKLALLTMPAAQPNALPESMMLAEGQAQEGIEIREIDEKAGIVKIINHGEPQTLDFDHDGAKPSGPLSTPGPNPARLPPPGEPPRGVTPELPPSRSDLSPEEQVALIEVQRVKYQQENNLLGKILPPTELVPGVDALAP